MHPRDQRFCPLNMLLSGYVLSRSAPHLLLFNASDRDSCKYLDSETISDFFSFNETFEWWNTSSLLVRHDGLRYQVPSSKPGMEAWKAEVSWGAPSYSVHSVRAKLSPILLSSELPHYRAQTRRASPSACSTVLTASPESDGSLIFVANRKG